MARSPQEKPYRTQLTSHLYHMHGETTMRPGMKLSIEDLEEMHRMFHEDDYACPPHSHAEKAEAYHLHEVELKYDDEYVDSIIAAVKGEQ